ncbi:ribosome maturation factor RimM [Erysipelothrix urinaevulpis]|uniref:ribosome maturation factor RimM n=1 Tax=Erysipelothrix urinaevulpis TaxID=2683717 RepID=UPI00135C28C9|nr:ribosome maturation factor RimM [Erysipelothrix urinaevulpis]
MEKIVIGRINKPHGVMGELRVSVYTEFIEERFKIGESVFVEVNDSLVEYTLKSMRKHKDIFLVQFEGISNLNQVDHLRNALIKIDYQDLHDLPEGQYYFVDLVGLDVFVENNKIGVITEILDMPAHPIIKVKTNDRELMIPYVDRFVKKVNLEENRMDIDWLEGL